MDLRFTPEETAFRKEVRTFFRTAIPAEIRTKVSEGRKLAREDYVTSQRILNDKGWAVPHWPVEHGGQEWSAVKRYIFMEELMQAAVPLPLQFNCFMVGPVIATFGSEAQKRRFLPRIKSLEDWWCQGFSEPGAGSDLASLKTRAVREGDHYIIDGQKTWTTLGQYADWMFCLARTDPAAKKQTGISFILVDMRSPGVTVRPIITIDGRHEVNEVFLDAVKVPVENLVGEENKGWDYAKFLLANERTGIARIGMSKERIARIKRLARTTPAGAGTMWDDLDFRSRLASVEIELKALEITQMRVVAAQATRDPTKPDPASSILKIKGSELQQATTELLLELAGPQALPALRDGAGDNDAEALFAWADAAAPVYFNHRKVSIYGGSNEIQHNVIAKAILGL
ncbi:acyl-CoA dehydrogenase family protein [Xanthobacter autotrophicus]|jgi:pimeloyl-CoA dehydrogenase large subunit|uniref:acyl-CoA dehydrogenase family protein n=1 Tax=Xanthobacter TaxID=279 RepID=UPI001E5B8F08|nr:acyl-CoA dehydrogenase family protein [Xanthobacter autotrophicus]UDQ88631.1 acyl-CoA dehydrogenase family protein [Xanthobacter autotrophicus]